MSTTFGDEYFSNNDFCYRASPKDEGSEDLFEDFDSEDFNDSNVLFGDEDLENLEEIDEDEFFSREQKDFEDDIEEIPEELLSQDDIEDLFGDDEDIGEDVDEDFDTDR
ncbi:MAG: hypothetical protein N2517_04165 [Ignavibacteria bacterium]|nr:hypothetical protein [Ignavibacteria bacterium]